VPAALTSSARLATYNRKRKRDCKWDT
jgi:hypothetical protein